PDSPRIQLRSDNHAHTRKQTAGRGCKSCPHVLCPSPENLGLAMVIPRRRACENAIGVRDREDEAVYKIIYGPVAERPGVRGNFLKRMVGARGFEPPTPWSRTRFQALLKDIDFW